MVELNSQRNWCLVWEKRLGFSLCVRTRRGKRCECWIFYSARIFNSIEKDEKLPKPTKNHPLYIPTNCITTFGMKFAMKLRWNVAFPFAKWGKCANELSWYDLLIIICPIFLSREIRLFFFILVENCLQSAFWLCSRHKKNGSKNEDFIKNVQSCWICLSFYFGNLPQILIIKSVECEQTRAKSGKLSETDNLIWNEHSF